jgi:hypothetical protein
MVLDAAGLSSQSRTGVRTAEERTREEWQPWRGWCGESCSELISLPVQGSIQGSLAILIMVQFGPLRHEELEL